MLPIWELPGVDEVPTRHVPRTMILGAVDSCGGNSTGPEDSLTRDEDLALVEVATGQGFALTENAVLGSGTVAPESSTTQFTAPCAMGGTTVVDARPTLPETRRAGTSPSHSRRPLFTRVAWAGTRQPGSCSPSTAHPTLTWTLKFGWVHSGGWLGVRCTPGSRTLHGYIAPRGHPSCLQREARSRGLDPARRAPPLVVCCETAGSRFVTYMIALGFLGHQ